MKIRSLAILLPILAFAACKEPIVDPDPVCSFDEIYVEVAPRSADISFRTIVPEGVGVLQVGIALSTTDRPSEDSSALTKAAKLSHSGVNQFVMSGLEPLTTYWFQPYAIHYDETVTYGDAQSFSTLAAKSLEGHEFVNLGLKSGTKWSTFNAEDSGSSLIPWADAESYVKSVWGDSWRLPSKADWEELMDPANCFWSWDIQNGMQGMLVKGSNGNSIFLPAAGYAAQGHVLQYNEYGAYWTSDEVESTPGSAWCLFFGVDFVYWNPMNFVVGCSVRPVNNASIYDYD